MVSCDYCSMSFSSRWEKEKHEKSYCEAKRKGGTKIHDSDPVKTMKTKKNETAKIKQQELRDYGK
uniref:Uncharacterized protein n=1 Tax=viral metagenome TaxID=1070528 RepID=A0A6C0JW73_9ZZZZ